MQSALAHSGLDDENDPKVMYDKLVTQISYVFGIPKPEAPVPEPVPEPVAQCESAAQSVPQPDQKDQFNSVDTV